MGSGEEKPCVMCAEGFFSAVFTMVILVMAQIADVVCSKCLRVDKFVSVSICLGVLNSRGQEKMLGYFSMYGIVWYHSECQIEGGSGNDMSLQR